MKIGLKKNRILPVIPFGYPNNFENTGPFWTNEMNKDLIYKTLHNVYDYSEEEWIEVKKKLSLKSCTMIQVIQ